MASESQGLVYNPKAKICYRPDERGQLFELGSDDHRFDCILLMERGTTSEPGHTATKV